MKGDDGRPLSVDACLAVCRISRRRFSGINVLLSNLIFITKASFNRMV